MIHFKVCIPLDSCQQAREKNKPKKKAYSFRTPGEMGHFDQHHRRRIACLQNVLRNVMLL